MWLSSFVFCRAWLKIGPGLFRAFSGFLKLMFWGPSTEPVPTGSGQGPIPALMITKSYSRNYGKKVFDNNHSRGIILGSVRHRHTGRWQSQMINVLFRKTKKLFHSCEKCSGLASGTSNAICSRKRPLWPPLVGCMFPCFSEVGGTTEPRAHAVGSRGCGFDSHWMLVFVFLLSFPLFSFFFLFILRQMAWLRFFSNSFAAAWFEPMTELHQTIRTFRTLYRMSYRFFPSHFVLNQWCPKVGPSRRCISTYCGLKFKCLKLCWLGRN